MQRHFALAAFPRVENVGVEFLASMSEVCGLVEKCYLLKYEIVALGNKIGMLGKQFEAFVGQYVQAFIQLVEFH